MGRRQRRREGGGATRGRVPDTKTAYLDAENNALVVRNGLSAGTLAELRGLAGPAAATSEDLWQRREELLFERLVVSWEIAGLPLEGQRELLGRYRMADAQTRAWVRGTIDDHLRTHQPEALG